MCVHKQSPQTLTAVGLDLCRASKTLIRYVMSSDKKQAVKIKEAKSTELKTLNIIKVFEF